MDQENEMFDAHSLSDALDNAILMHRDAHFGGNFELMLNYYKNEGKGVHPDFRLGRIVELADMEKQMGQNLAAILLSGPEAEKVAKSKEAYKILRDLFEEEDDERKKHARLLADLILSEEEEPLKEMAAIIAEKEAIVRPLIDLLQAEDFYDPLFPGYGEAPILAAKCLGEIGDKRAIISLFESLGTSDFFNEDIALKALQTIGEPAKQFLLKVLQSRPLTADNEKAAIALLQFKESSDVSSACFKMLQDPQVLKDLPLCTYLIMGCEHLESLELKESFLKMLEDPKLPKPLKLDMQTIAKEWKKTKG